MEEDAGKSIHDRFAGHTAIDLNRSGTPLIEIVSEPDLRSAADTGVYLKRLKQVLEYLEVSDANMEEGSLRVDANISIREAGASKLGTKTEIKNMNSFSGVERALEAEFKRQVALVESGSRVAQQTLLWDTHRNETRPARSKEESHDYRYFPEPDLPPVRLTNEWLSSVRTDLPELPDARRQRFVAALGIPVYDAEVLTAERSLADYYEGVAKAHGDAKVSANWVMGEVMARMNEAGTSIESLRVSPKQLGGLLDMVRDGAVSNSAAKTIFARMFEGGEDAAVVADREGLRLVGDDDQLAKWVDAVLAADPDVTRRFVGGEKKLIGVLVGQVMKASGGKADPKKVNRMLSERVTA